MAATRNTELRESEREVIAALRSGQPICFADPPSGQTPEPLRSSLIRAVLFGDSLPDGSRDQDQPPLVHIEGATFEGELDLQHLRSRHGAPAVIKFKDCRFIDPIRLNYAHVGAVSFDHCFVYLFEAIGCHFDSFFRFHDCISSQRANEYDGCVRDGEALPRLELNLRDSVVGTGISIQRTTLVGQPHDKSRDTTGGGKSYALSLAGARVTGEVVCQPGFSAVGGINLSNAIISGVVWLGGAQLSAEWDAALDLGGAKLGRHLWLGTIERPDGPLERFRATGRIYLYSTEIAGDLFMHGAQLDASAGDLFTVVTHRSIIAGVLRLCSVASKAGDTHVTMDARGALFFDDTVFGGIQIRGASLDGLGSEALHLPSCHVRGEVLFTEGAATGERHISTKLAGALNAERLTIVGSCIIEAVIDAPMARSINLTAAKCGAGLTIRSSTIDQGPLCLIGLENAEVLGDLRLEGLRVEGLRGGGSLLADALNVSGDIVIDKCRFDGVVRMDLSTGGSVRLSEVAVTEDNETSIRVSNADIGGGLSFRKVKATSRINLDETRISGSLEFIQTDVGGRLPIYAPGIKVGGNLLLKEVSAPNEALFDNASVAGVTEFLNYVGKGYPGRPPGVLLNDAVLSGGLRIGNLKDVGFRATAAIEDERFIAARMKPLSFHPGYYVVEMLIRGERELGVLSLVWDGADNLVTLDGRANTMHGFRERHHFVLNDDTVSEYAAYFTGHLSVEGQLGPWITDQARLGITELDAAELHESLVPVVTRTSTGWSIRACLQHMDRVLVAGVRVTTDGSVTFDNITGRKGGRIIERFVAPLRLAPAARDPLEEEMSWRLDDTIAFPTERWLPGVWERPDNDLAARAAAALERSGRSEHVYRIRWRPTPILPRWRLVQAVVRHPRGAALIAWLWDGKDGVQVLGVPAEFNSFVSGLQISLDDDQAVRDYVSLALATVPELGVVLFAEPADAPLPNITDIGLSHLREFRVERQGRTINVDATALLDTRIISVVCRVEPNRTIAFEKLETLVELSERALSYDAGYVAATALSPTEERLDERISHAWPVPPAMPGNWQPVDGHAFTLLTAAFSRSSKEAKLRVSLRGASTSQVDDRIGEAWGNVQLQLSQFTYARIDSGTLKAIADEKEFAAAPDPAELNVSFAKRRLTWLALQHIDAPKRDTFDPQPHTQLAAIYREQGRVDDAREIILDRIRVSGTLSALAHMRNSWRAIALAALPVAVALLIARAPTPWALGVPALVAAMLVFAPIALHFLYGALFGHGLKGFSAFCTFAICLMIGSLAVMAANRDPLTLPPLNVGGVHIAAATLLDFSNFPQVMMQDLTPVQDAVQMTGGANPKLETATAIVGPEGKFATSLPCGTAISPLLYAADVFIPVLDLRQEAKCSPSSDALGWAWAKSLYAMLGWIVTSLMILTMTGVLRERLER